MRKKTLPRRISPRLKGYDYSSDGIYLVTICVRDRKCMFGEVINGKNELNCIGRIAGELWMQIPATFENIKIDDFVVMPNHVHGIVIIDNRKESVGSIVPAPDAINRVPARGGGITGKNNPMLSRNSLARIIRWYKGRCTYEIRQTGHAKNFAWQSRYDDRIVRHEKELCKVREYIRDNPPQWESDRLNPRNPQ
jgi:REP element-mobilizing transposase RayT